MQLLENKFAIITGAGSARGLGKAAAALFAEHGATVAILDLDAAQAAQAAADIGPQHVGLACDVADQKRVLDVFESLLQKWGQVDILVNNAGIVQPERVMEITPEGLDKALDVAVRGALYCSQALVPHFCARKTGSIVNVSSIAAQRGGGIFGGAHYAAAKAGMLGLTKAMARELAPENVRVNALCPGFVDTDINKGRMSEELKQKIVAGIPLGRAGSSREVAGSILFLASELSSFCTGIELDANGGAHIH